jgi:hypothetical protein
MLLGAIPTLVAGIAIMTLAAPQKSGVSLDHVKLTLAKGPSHPASHSNHQTTNTSARTNHGPQRSQAQSTDQTLSYGYGGYRGYHSYRGYRGYRGYHGYRGWRGYHSYYSYEGNDDMPEEE